MKIPLRSTVLLELLIPTPEVSLRATFQLLLLLKQWMDQYTGLRLFELVLAMSRSGVLLTLCTSFLHQVTCGSHRLIQVPFTVWQLARSAVYSPPGMSLRFLRLLEVEHVGREDVEERTKGVPDSSHKKFTTWELACDWYIIKYQAGRVACKPFVRGPYDPCGNDEEALSRAFATQSLIGSYSHHTCQIFTDF
jgi:hypothetical protein